MSSLGFLLIDLLWRLYNRLQLYQGSYIPYTIITENVLSCNTILRWLSFDYLFSNFSLKICANDKILTFALKTIFQLFVDTKDVCEKYPNVKQYMEKKLHVE